MKKAFSAAYLSLSNLSTNLLMLSFNVFCIARIYFGKCLRGSACKEDLTLMFQHFKTYSQLRLISSVQNCILPAVFSAPYSYLT